MRTRGDWEGWIEFFLQGVVEVSHEAAATAKAILAVLEWLDITPAGANGVVNRLVAIGLDFHANHGHPINSGGGAE